MNDNTALCLPGMLIFQIILTFCTETPVTFLISVEYLTL